LSFGFVDLVNKGSVEIVHFGIAFMSGSIGLNSVFERIVAL
jgi:hypothetical protein